MINISIRYERERETLSEITCSHETSVMSLECEDTAMAAPPPPMALTRQVTGTYDREPSEAFDGAVVDWRADVGGCCAGV